jgi:hypothetical protein
MSTPDDDIQIETADAVASNAKGKGKAKKGHVKIVTEVTEDVLTLDAFVQVDRMYLLFPISFKNNTIEKRLVIHQVLDRLDTKLLPSVRSVRLYRVSGSPPTWMTKTPETVVFSETKESKL